MRRPPVRILFVNEKCGFFGGVEQNIAETAAGLRLRGHHCALAWKELTGRDVPAFQANFDECVTVFPLSKAVEIFRPDVIYIHKAQVGELGDFPPDLRVVRMVHDHDLCCPRRHKYYAWNGRVCHHKADWRCYLDAAFISRTPDSRKLEFISIEKKMVEMRRNQKLDLLLVGSNSMRQELTQNGFDQRRVAVLAPVVRIPARQMPPIPAENRILYVGQLIHGKGVDLLIRALPHIRCDYELTIVGTGNGQAVLEDLCRSLGITDKVRFAGWVSPTQIGDFYAAAKVIAIPSRWPEPFGMVGLEAMHYGRPVVGFNTGGIPDWLEHGVTGLLVQEQDIIALAQALKQMLTDPDRCLLYGRQAQERVREKFCFERYLDQLQEHLLGHVPERVEPK